MNEIHALAVVDVRAEIGDSVFIGPFSQIGPYARIGHGTQVHGATVNGSVGRNCFLWRGANVMDGAEIGDKCMLAENVMVGRARLGDGVRVQNGTTIPHLAVIGDDVYIGAGVRLCNSVHPSASYEDELVEITIKRAASIGCNVCIIGRVTIGTGAIVGAGAVVTKDVPARTRAVGVPAVAG